MKLSNSLLLTILTTIAIGHPIEGIDDSVKDIETQFEETMFPNKELQAPTEMINEDYTKNNEVVSFAELDEVESSFELDDLEFEPSTGSEPELEAEESLEGSQLKESEVSATNQGGFPMKKKKKTTIWNIGPKILGGMLGRSNRASSKSKGKGKGKSKGKGNTWAWPGTSKGKGKTNSNGGISNDMNGNAPDDDSDAMAIITLNIGDLDKPVSSEGVMQASTTSINVVKRAAAGDDVGPTTITTTEIVYGYGGWIVDGASFTATTLDTSFVSTETHTGRGGGVESSDFSSLSWPIETSII
ncbi:unnamed protein product [Ambrosiozyma monospora]|uniref:Unnamed protein product n=1 Tax=Ambrosiozyma monospora TaxID=43982 RepID=A0A9W6YXI5_AMBMO|nr:unnamed protein product [Ambrosiozyma monospora]